MEKTVPLRRLYSAVRWVEMPPARGELKRIHKSLLLDYANYPVPSFTTEPKETDPMSQLGQKVSLSLSLYVSGGAFYALVFL